MEEIAADVVAEALAGRDVLSVCAQDDPQDADRLWRRQRSTLWDIQKESQSSLSKEGAVVFTVDASQGVEAVQGDPVTVHFGQLEILVTS